jgi:hypothetical protein
MALDKDEIITALSQLSEREAAEVIATARKNDREQAKERAAQALRQFVHPRTQSTDQETEE